MVRLMKRDRHGARWDEVADAELRRRFEAGELLPDVARAMNRSQEAVRTRANVLHVPVRSTSRATAPSAAASAVASATVASADAAAANVATAVTATLSSLEPDAA